MGGILKLKVEKRGYKRVMLCKANKREVLSAHRLVAIAFRGNPENKPMINHKDGDPGNNYYTNLEWCTQSENELHKLRVLKKTNGIQNRPGVKINTKNPIVYSGKYFYGVIAQNLVYRMLKGELIRVSDFDKTPTALYSMMNKLKKQGLPIENQIYLDNKKEYFIAPINIKKIINETRTANR